MSENLELYQRLLEKIKVKRAGINAYAKDIDSRSSRLTNWSIICTALTTVLTAGPAIGRENFTKFVTSIIPVNDPQVWGTLCLLAMILSIVAAITNNLNRSRELASHLAKAQAASLLLEKLENSLEFKQIPVSQAAKLYEQYIVDLPYIQELITAK